VKISSSGIEASKNLSGPISWYTSRLAKHHKIAKHLAHTWTQTTTKVLSDVDIVIFMASIHHDRVEKEFNFKGKYETWDIPDLEDLGIIPALNTLEEDLKRIKFSEETYGKIQREVDTLIRTISKTVLGDS
jgi:protein-tyrosine-phosphatase